MACYADSLAFDAGPDAIMVADLGREPVLAELLDRFGQAYPGSDTRAVASFWSQHYFARVLIPLTLLLLRVERPLCLDIVGSRVRFDPERGVPARVHLALRGSPRSGIAVFRSLVDDHVAAVVAGLNRQCGLSTRLLWENAGCYVTWIAGEVARMDGPGSALAVRLLQDDGWPRDGYAFPHLKRAALARTPSVRRLCCLRYVLPTVGRCEGVCPVRPFEPAPTRAG